MKRLNFFSADLHVGENPAKGNPSYYRPMLPEFYQQQFLEQCHRQIRRTDRLYLVGDLVTQLKYLEFYQQLPDCELYIFLGNKEKKLPDFIAEAQKILARDTSRVEFIRDWKVVDISGRLWRIGHRPEDIAALEPALPCICGHVHGFWRTRQLKNGQPIINVGVDAWSHALVTEEFINLQYEGVMNGRFQKIIDFEEG